MASLIGIVPVTARAADGGGTNMPPVIVTQPESQTALAGSTVVFTVGVTGTPPFMYRWTRNGTTVRLTTDGALVLSNVQPAHAGNYRVVVTNAVGMALSSNATLTVLGTNAPEQTVVSVVASDAQATEPGILTVVDAGQFRILRRGNLHAEIPVWFRLSGTASNGIDYSFISNSVVIPAGATQALVNVLPLLDNALEGAETVVLNIDPILCPAIFPPPPGCYIVENGQATVTIRDATRTSNHLPEVAITTPTNGTVFGASASIHIEAFTRDPDGYVSEVEFYAGQHKIGEASIAFIQPPPPGEPLVFDMVWTNPPPGLHVLRALAFDDGGAVGTSAPVNITVLGTNPPTPRTVVSVLATDPEAREPGAPSDIIVINHGEFSVRRSGNLGASIPVRFQLTGTASNGVDYAMIPGEAVIPAGTNQVLVRVTPLADNLIEGTESVILTVLPPICAATNAPECYLVGASSSATVFLTDAPPSPTNPPMVVIVAPVNGAVFPAGTNIFLVANTATAGVDRVEFYSNNLFLGQAVRAAGTAASWGFMWSNAPAGNHALRAIATDTLGRRDTSAPVNITVTGAAGPLVRVFATDSQASEPSGGAVNPGQFTFVRSGPPTNFMPVFFSVGGTATQGADYLPLTNVVVFLPGMTNVNLAIHPIDDDVVEPTETVAVTLQPPPTQPGSIPYVLAPPSQATVFIQDNDSNSPPARTLIAAGSTWKYHDLGADLGTLWREPAFDDAHWAAGPAQLGYGDGDEATVIDGGPPTNRFITTYFRYSFFTTNVGQLSNLTVRLLRDDGGIVYLNGVEVFRSNMPGGSIDFLTLASMASEEPNVFHSATIDPGLLVNGRNVVAVEVHQNSPFSTDLSFDLELIAGPAAPPAERTVITVTATDPQATEPGVTTVINPGQFTIRRNGNLGAAIPVQLSLGGTASNGLDYNIVSNILVIPAGVTQSVVTIVPRTDNVVEGIETVVLTLLEPACPAVFPPPPTCYVVGVPSQATVFIHDGPIASNHPPSATIVAPSDGDSFRAPASIHLRASAHDPDGNLQRVEFRANGAFIGNAIGSLSNSAAGWVLNWSNVQAGAYVLNAIAVDTSGARGTSAPVHVTVALPPPPTNRELHVVSVYSGLFNGGSSPNHERGDAFVTVDRPGRVVTLYLSAYEPVLWHVEVGAGTQIERVFLGGYYAQEIAGLPDRTPVFPTSGFVGYDLDCARFYLSVPRIHEATGQEIASFHGSYVAAEPFLIDAVQDDPRLHSSYPQPVTNGLPDLSFRLSFARRGEANVFVRDYTLRGRSNAVDVIPAMRVFADPAGRYFYGAESHEVWRIDTEANAAHEMTLPPGLPEFSWAWSGAYDTQRNRFLVSSFGGTGYLYGYSPPGQSWSVVRDLENLDLSAIGWHAATDEIFGLSTMFSECSPVVLYRLNANGELLGSTPLPIVPFGRYGMRSQIVSVGDYLVLLMEADGSFGDKADSRIYLFDPRTDELWLSYRSGATPGVIDSDGDGVPDARDLCPHTPPGVPVNDSGCPIMVADADNDGVPDSGDECPGTSPGAVVNGAGCSIAQIAPCDGPWRNHAEYVNAVESAAEAFQKAGLITFEERREIVLQARRSQCGRRLPALRVPIQCTDEIRTNGCRLVLDGDGPATCVIEVSTDLVNWTVISTNVLDGTSIPIVDPESRSAPRRFYRLRTLPAPMMKNAP